MMTLRIEWKYQIPFFLFANLKNVLVSKQISSLSKSCIAPLDRGDQQSYVFLNRITYSRYFHQKFLKS